MGMDNEQKVWGDWVTLTDCKGYKWGAFPLCHEMNGDHDGMKPELELLIIHSKNGSEGCNWSIKCTKSKAVTIWTQVM